MSAFFVLQFLCAFRTIRDMRSMKVKDIVKKLNEILVGYYHYYGITDNSRSINNFRFEVNKRLFY